MSEVRVGDIYRYTFDSDEFHTEGKCYTILEIRDNSKDIRISSNKEIGYFATVGSLGIFFEPVISPSVLMKDLFDTIEQS